jgi:hypothetical protein
MDNRERLDQLIVTHESLANLPWTTIHGQKMTLGTMTDEHLDACIAYHQSIVDRINSGAIWGGAAMLEVAEFIVFMMKENRKSRAQHADH